MVSPKDAFDDLTGISRFVVTTGRQLEDFINQGTTHVVRQLQVRVYQGVTLANPVDTGHSRSGWTPLVGRTIDTPLPRPGVRAQAVSNARSRLASNRSSSNRISNSYTLNNGKVFIANNVPYIVQLDQGSSPQAPRNFVLMAIQNAIASF